MLKVIVVLVCNEMDRLFHLDVSVGGENSSLPAAFEISFGPHIDTQSYVA
jgi:hypothetical protein